jgi:ABC-type phosphate/phosphonate transport system permease subunit
MAILGGRAGFRNLNSTIGRISAGRRAESAVLGLVGAGGIGVALDTALNLLYWDQVAVVLLAIFIVVILAEIIVTVVRAKVL